MLTAANTTSNAAPAALSDAAVGSTGENLSVYVMEKPYFSLEYVVAGRCVPPAGAVSQPAPAKVPAASSARPARAIATVRSGGRDRFDAGASERTHCTVNVLTASSSSPLSFSQSELTDCAVIWYSCFPLKRKNVTAVSSLPPSVYVYLNA